MVPVDPEDDSIDRWVISHYRFDPVRRQRRHVAVAAFDDEAEFTADLARRSTELTAQIAAGTASAGEHLTGMRREAGSRAAAARGHRMRRAFEHGVSAERLVAEGPLPPNMSFLTLSDDEVRRDSSPKA